MVRCFELWWPRRVTAPATIAALMLTAGMAFAECSAADLFLSCRIAQNGKLLEVCVEGDAVVYRYGPAGGAPELTLREAAATLGYTPWPGIGRTIWEEVRFFNGDYEYRVNGAIDKMLAVEDSPEAKSGGVEVYRGAQRAAALDCAPATVRFDWTAAIGDAKRAAGLDWDPGAQAWLPAN
ncbi:hypothetical protein [Tropicibacter oceani]|uniref:Uncharacterized protein n=1 Tax=Tropicibacter oceani TaxID=3058420 RepID=A0ABY8QGS9_9RHOB|nr:hypothetical protein [Tropicibacter oceani]WGW03829.1 hypothetical protein QF118_18225 [Tropicibacter oceani]